MLVGQLRESQATIDDLNNSLAAERRLVEDQGKELEKARLEAARAFVDGFFNFVDQAIEKFPGLGLE